jgi:hypothetical protein
LMHVGLHHESFSQAAQVAQELITMLSICFMEISTPNDISPPQSRLLARLRPAGRQAAGEAIRTGRRDPTRLRAGRG